MPYTTRCTAPVRNKLPALLSLLPPALLLWALFVGQALSPALMLLFAVLLHECAHALAMLLLRAGPLRFTGAMGGFLLSPARPLSDGEEAFVTLAGPFSNLLCCGICLLLCAPTGGGEKMVAMATVQLLTGFCNLLPAPGTDGGRLLGLLLCRRLGRVRGRRVIAAFGSGIFAFLFFLTLYLFYRGVCDLSLFVFAVAGWARLCGEAEEDAGQEREKT